MINTETHLVLHAMCLLLLSDFNKKSECVKFSFRCHGHPLSGSWVKTGGLFNFNETEKHTNRREKHITGALQNSHIPMVTQDWAWRASIGTQNASSNNI